MLKHKQHTHTIIRLLILLLAVFSFAYIANRSITALPMASTTSSAANSYSTNFPHAKNPISEGGKWVSGKKHGLDWADVAVIPGFAFGTEIGGNRPELEKYDDSTALLTGT